MNKLNRSIVHRFAARAALFAATVLLSSHAHADVPARVGRIALMEGDVQSYSETDPEWKVAYVNEPITSHNSIFVGDTGRAEISVGSTTLAMDAGSQVDIQQLDDNTFNANVVRGRVSLRVRRFDPSDAYNVAVPGAVFALLQPGRYRVDALDGASGITVFAGQASVQGGQGPMTVGAGNAMRVIANAQDPNAPPQFVAAGPVPVPLDDWVVARENRFADSQTQRYVSPNMTGYEDLGDNGRWASEPDVGPIWYPTTYVNAEWAPYRYGRWAYVAPWGYTWIDDAPWGFAPFHYGRWLQVGGRWGWCPGAYVGRPVYAPALVGFYGGDGFSASFSVGVGPAVGWYPLAPWERFTPYYAHNTAYVNQVNNITVINAPARFAAREGWNREHGATVVPRDAFASQRSISRVAIAAPPGAIGRASVVNGGELPRPNAVPGAARRGPEPGVGAPRPEFRQPRDFAEHAPVGGPRAAEAGRPQGAPFEPRGAEAGRAQGAPVERPVDRATLPPNYQRLPETPRAAEAPRATQPGAPTAPQVERGQPRGPNAPNFSPEGRPVEQQRVQPVAPAPSAGDVPNPRSPNVERFNARQQAMQQREQANVDRGAQPGPNVERNADRPNRDFRAPQAPQTPQAPQAPQVQQPARPQPTERPQHVEQKAAPAAPAAPAAAPAAPPKAEQRGPGPGREGERDR